MGKHVRLAEQYKDRLYRARSEDGKVLATIVGTTPVYLEDPVPTEVLKRLTTGFLVEVSEADYKQAVEAEQKKQAESRAAAATAAPSVAAPAAGPDVAALEARVAELEAKLEAMSAQSEEPEGDGEGDKAGGDKADAGAGGKSKSSAKSNSDPK